MLFLLQDAQRIPRIFSPFGAIPSLEIQDWLRRTGLNLPSDLIEFWQQSGGGDVFESETILRPTVPSTPNSCFVDDFIEAINAAYAEEGKSADLYVFHRGLFPSAVQLSDQHFVTLTERSYTVKDSFASFDEWYVRTLRAEYRERYGLPAIGAGF